VQRLANTFGNYGGVECMTMIGLYDPSQDQHGESHAANFMWADSSPVDYTNWGTGEPNDNGGDEFWTEMYSAAILGQTVYPVGPASTWNDVPDVTYPHPNNGKVYHRGRLYGVV
jgi:hypothetical protein